MVKIDQSAAQSYLDFFLKSVTSVYKNIFIKKVIPKRQMLLFNIEKITNI